MRPPHELRGNRLRPWNRFRWYLGFKPFRRCPNGIHVWRNIYGDEIIFGANCKYRSACHDCLATSPTLIPGAG